MHHSNFVKKLVDLSTAFTEWNIVIYPVVLQCLSLISMDWFTLPLSQFPFALDSGLWAQGHFQSSFWTLLFVIPNGVMHNISLPKGQTAVVCVLHNIGLIKNNLCCYYCKHSTADTKHFRSGFDACCGQLKVCCVIFMSAGSVAYICLVLSARTLVHICKCFQMNLHRQQPWAADLDICL